MRRRKRNSSKHHLYRLPGGVSVSQQFVACRLDAVHLLFPEFQLSHQTLWSSRTTVISLRSNQREWGSHFVTLPSSCPSWTPCWCFVRSSRSWPPPPPSHWATWVLWSLHWQKCGAPLGSANGPLMRSAGTQKNEIKELFWTSSYIFTNYSSDSPGAFRTEAPVFPDTRGMLVYWRVKSDPEKKKKRKK